MMLLYSDLLLIWFYSIFFYFFFILFLLLLILFLSSCSWACGDLEWPWEDPEDWALPSGRGAGGRPRCWCPQGKPEVKNPSNTTEAGWLFLCDDDSHPKTRLLWGESEYFSEEDWGLWSDERNEGKFSSFKSLLLSPPHKTTAQSFSWWSQVVAKWGGQAPRTRSRVKLGCSPSMLAALWFRCCKSRDPCWPSGQSATSPHTWCQQELW